MTSKKSNLEAEEDWAVTPAEEVSELDLMNDEELESLLES